MLVVLNIIVTFAPCYYKTHVQHYKQTYFATMVQTLEDLKNEVLEKAQAQIRLIEHDYHKGMEDCCNGIYDKRFRYNRKDDGHAYDEGWVFQNRTTGNETVQFING